MTLDPDILREAKDVLALYSKPAQELIKQNLYGPREARLAGAIVANIFTVEVHHEPTETELLADVKARAWEQIETLCTLLRRAMTLVEERVAGAHSELLQECEDAIAMSEEDFEVEVEADDGDEEEPPKRLLCVVVFPALDPDGTLVSDFVDKLTLRGVTVWVADENDQSKRLKAMTMREIYNVGRIAAVVVTDRDGTVLDGWYNGLPWIEEVMAKIQELRA